MALLVLLQVPLGSSLTRPSPFWLHHCNILGFCYGANNKLLYLLGGGRRDSPPTPPIVNAEAAMRSAPALSRCGRVSVEPRQHLQGMPPLRKLGNEHLHCRSDPIVKIRSEETSNGVGAVMRGRAPRWKDNSSRTRHKHTPMKATYLTWFNPN